MSRFAHEVVDLIELLSCDAWEKPMEERAEKARSMRGRSEPGGGAENDGHPEDHWEPIFAEAAKHGQKGTG